MDRQQKNLSERELAQRIRDWFESLVRQAPEADPRSTQHCLSIPKAVAFVCNEVMLDDAQRQHIATCSFCQRAITIARKVVIDEQRLQGQISDETKAWPEILRQRLREWVAKQPAEQDSPARFNEEGVLEVEWRGLSMEGHVRLSFLWGDTPIPLGEGVVRDGTLKFSRPLPHFGLRNLSISRRLLLLEWDLDAGGQ